MHDCRHKRSDELLVDSVNIPNAAATAWCAHQVDPAACYKTCVAFTEGTSTRTIVSPHLILLALVISAKLQVAEAVLGQYYWAWLFQLYNFIQLVPSHARQLQASVP